jgi:hypothetical protein
VLGQGQLGQLQLILVGLCVGLSGTGGFVNP